MQSGSAFSPWAFQDDKKEKEMEDAYMIGRAMGCDATESAALVTCLETKNAQELWAAAETVRIIISQSSITSMIK